MWPRVCGEDGLTPPQARARAAAAKYREAQEAETSSKLFSGKIWQGIAMINAVRFVRRPQPTARCQAPAAPRLSVADSAWLRSDQAVALAMCTVKGHQYFELTLAGDLFPQDMMQLIDDRIPMSLFLFSLVNAVQTLNTTLKEPSREAISGCGSGQSIAAIFTLVLYLECE